MLKLFLTNTLILVLIIIILSITLSTKEQNIIIEKNLINLSEQKYINNEKRIILHGRLVLKRNDFK